MQTDYEQNSYYSDNTAWLQKSALSSEKPADIKLLAAFLTIKNFRDLLFGHKVNLANDINKEFMRDIMVPDFERIILSLREYRGMKRKGVQEALHFMNGAVKALYSASKASTGKSASQATVFRVKALLSCRDELYAAYLHLEHLNQDLKALESQTSSDKLKATPGVDLQQETWIHEVVAEDEVSFTAIYSSHASVESWHSLLVYAHLASAIEKVRRDANHLKGEMVLPKEISLPSATRLARGTEITIIPSCDEVEFNPSQISVKWLEDYHLTYFRFRASKALANAEITGQINICVGPLIIGILQLPLSFNKKQSKALHKNEVQASMYHEDDIFVSYSHDDTAIALACKSAYEALGFNVLIDIDTLRAGQIWEEELERMIERASIFQLFWSQNSSQSKYCRKEWRYALRCKKGAGFIRPVYWKKPLPNPPRELSKFHFAYVELERPID